MRRLLLFIIIASVSLSLISAMNVGVNNGFKPKVIITAPTEDLGTIYHNATESGAVAGTINGGILADTQHPNGAYDGKTFNFSEVTGSPGLDLRMNFTNITDFYKGVIRYKTSSLAGDAPIIQIWDYLDGEWETYSSLTESLSFATIEQSVFDDSAHINNSIVQVRLYKAANGNTQNSYFVDWITIISGIGASPSGTEVDPVWTTFKPNVTIWLYNQTDIGQFEYNHSLYIVNTYGQWFYNHTLATGWINDGTQSYLIDSNDKVGIGTATPEQKLDVVGNINSTADGYFGDDLFVTDDATISGGSMGLYNSAASSIFTIENDGNGNKGAINFVRERAAGANTAGGAIEMYSDTSTNSASLLFKTETAYSGQATTRGMMRLTASDGKLDLMNGLAGGTDYGIGKTFKLNFNLLDDTNVETTYASLYGYVADETNGTEDGQLRIYTMRNSVLTFSSVFDQNGRLGIGTTVPSHLLTISNSAISMNVSGMLYVNSSNVGIGTATPSTQLDVNGNVTVGGDYIVIPVSGDAPSITTDGAMYFDNEGADANSLCIYDGSWLCSGAFS